MCEKCNHKHKIGYFCNCECHKVVDRIIVERDFKKQLKGGKK